MVGCVFTMVGWLWGDEEGVTTVEYAILLMLIAIGSISVWQTFGARVAAVVVSGGDAVGSAHGR